MPTEDNSFEASCWNVKNSSQREGAVMSIAGRLIGIGYDGSVGRFIIDLRHAYYRFLGNYDVRWKEVKEFEAASQALSEAAFRFDKAREVLKARQAESRKGRR